MPTYLHIIYSHRVELQQPLWLKMPNYCGPTYKKFTKSCTWLESPWQQVQDLFLLSYISSASGPMSVTWTMHNQSIIINADSSGGPVVKNLPANAGEHRFSPWCGRFYMPQSNLACVPHSEAFTARGCALQQETPLQWEAPQLEKACVQW